MKYISGIHALNIPCSLLTGGDWHAGALKWESVTYKESDSSLFSDYGIEKEKYVEQLGGYFSVANHIRAILDLLEDGNFAVAQGMKKDYICNNKYNREIFEKVSVLAVCNNWKEINKFMAKEYGREWICFAKETKVWLIQKACC